MYINRNENKEKLESLPYFNLMAVRQLYDYSEATARQTLARWSKSGRIIRLKKDLYITRDFCLAHQADPDFAGFLSSVIQPFSYLSSVYVLQLGGILTETTYPVTGVTTKNTQSVTNRFGNFSYSHIKPELFGGYEEKNVWGVRMKKAGLGKALFDYFYFRHGPNWDLRFNWEEFSASDIKDYNYWVLASRSKKIPLWKRLLKD